MLTVAIKGLKTLDANLKKDIAAEKKAMETAIRVEGYRLRKTLIREIRAGAPGGKKFAPLSMLRRYGGKRRRNNPLYRLALGVRYRVDRDPFAMRVGFVSTGGSTRGIGRDKSRVSDSWQRLAAWHQEGFTKKITERQRRWFRLTGAGLTRRSKARKYMFLRKATTQFRTPARPIIEPFWRVHKEGAWRNIRQNYRRKLRGERI